MDQELKACIAELDQRLKQVEEGVSSSFEELDQTRSEVLLKIEAAEIRGNLLYRDLDRRTKDLEKPRERRFAEVQEAIRRIARRP